MINVEIIEAAEAELFKAAEFYGRQSAGLRAAFIDEFERVVGLIVDHPAIGAPYEAGTRRVLLARISVVTVRVFLRCRRAAMRRVGIMVVRCAVLAV